MAQAQQKLKERTYQNLIPGVSIIISSLLPITRSQGLDTYLPYAAENVGQITTYRHVSRPRGFQSTHRD